MSEMGSGSASYQRRVSGSRLPGSRLAHALALHLLSLSGFRESASDQALEPERVQEAPGGVEGRPKKGAWIAGGSGEGAALMLLSVPIKPRPSPNA
jgi:hypothetical protein